ncbi:15505_t:CDS:1 [Funneliformis caledonium]|uniref:15505_t:CDS:1 n=1 Tax=Funneliformis caledonium TaxID=1117310 RepID=A0A9N8ZJG6_9GLOM|nr:15505_t:CDS:1 [Funneliformis caledonium]
MPNNKKEKNRLHENEEISVGTAQMRKKLITNKFLQMMTCSKKSNEKEQAGSYRNSRKQIPAFKKDQETLSTNLSINDVNIEQRKSIESLTSDIDMGHKKLTEREPVNMELDNDYFYDTFGDSGKDYDSIATKVSTTS